MMQCRLWCHDVYVLKLTNASCDARVDSLALADLTELTCKVQLTMRCTANERENERVKRVCARVVDDRDPVTNRF